MQFYNSLNDLRSFIYFVIKIHVFDTLWTSYIHIEEMGLIPIRDKYLVFLLGRLGKVPNLFINGLSKRAHMTWRFHSHHNEDIPHSFKMLNITSWTHHINSCECHFLNWLCSKNQSIYMLLGLIWGARMPLCWLSLPSLSLLCYLHWYIICIFTTRIDNNCNSKYVW